MAREDNLIRQANQRIQDLRSQLAAGRGSDRQKQEYQSEISSLENYVQSLTGGGGISNGGVADAFVPQENQVQRTPDVRALPASSPQGNRYLDLFKGREYFDDPDFQNIVSQYEKRAGQFGADNAQPTFQQVSSYADTFKNQFKNYVGRDPNAEEFNRFFKFVSAEGPWAQEATAYAGKIGPEVTGHLKDFYTRTAQDEAQKKLEEQTASAIAPESEAPNSAFNVWQNSYRNSLGTVEKALTDYQTKLFEKIRPNLITSLQAQGLLNSGALNEAFAGAASDLTNESSNYLANARGAVEQDIANQRYQLASAPTSYQLSNTANAPTNLINSGQTALQNVWQGVMQQNEYNNAKNLAQMQPQQKSNPLSQYGGLVLGGLAAAFPQAALSYGGARAASGAFQPYTGTPGPYAYGS